MSEIFSMTDEAVLDELGQLKATFTDAEQELFERRLRQRAHWVGAPFNGDKRAVRKAKVFHRVGLTTRDELYEARQVRLNT